MQVLPIAATDDEIRALVVEWSELLAQRRYSDALALLPHSTEEIDWTPDLLKEAISTYGAIGGDRETTDNLLAYHRVSSFEITTLLGRPDSAEIIADIDVDREHLFGLDPKQYVGMVHYGDVPLSGFRSDLTARFHIKRVGTDQLTLEFLDIHVM
jgi:hypothetical protein